MIFIDLKKTPPPAAWVAKVAPIKKDLLAAKTAPKRREIIDKNEKLWRDDDLKEWLEALSNGKCWYSEAKDCCSYWHVDHFRPKNEVKDLDGKEYEGYWWLAFDWENYRLSGGVSNVKKSSVFPVRDDEWACVPSDDYREEDHLLLDPTEQLDPGLITFNSNGFPRPVPGIGDWNSKRVRESIKILHLRYKKLVDARKDCWQGCERKVNSARRHMGRVQKNIAGAKVSLTDAISDIREMVSPQTPFSSVARECVKSHNLEWLNKVLSLG